MTDPDPGGPKTYRSGSTALQGQGNHFLIINCYLLSPREDARLRRSLQLFNQNIQHFKTWYFLFFVYFCETFLPSWIRIRIPDSESGIRIRNPNPQSGSRFRNRNTKPESEAGIRIRNPNPESGIRVRNPSPESESRIRIRNLDPDPLIWLNLDTKHCFFWMEYLFFSKKIIKNVFKKSEDLTQKNPNWV